MIKCLLFFACCAVCFKAGVEYATPVETNLWQIWCESVDYMQLEEDMYTKSLNRVHI